MSTRCQVKVIQIGLDWEEEVTLYHHSDGYPEWMVPVIAAALKGHIERHDEETLKWSLTKDDLGKPRWQAGRAGKAASMLCWADPEQFEPEQGHKLHGDIEYYYKLYVVNKKGGSVDDYPDWELEVFTVEWEGAPAIKHERQPLADLLEIYPDKR